MKLNKNDIFYQKCMAELESRSPLESAAHVLASSILPQEVAIAIVVKEGAAQDEFQSLLERKVEGRIRWLPDISDLKPEDIRMAESFQGFGILGFNRANFAQQPPNYKDPLNDLAALIERQKLLNINRRNVGVIAIGSTSAGVDTDKLKAEEDIADVFGVWRELTVDGLGKILGEKSEDLNSEALRYSDPPSSALPKKAPGHLDNQQLP